MNEKKKRRCPACRQAELQPATRVREFRPHGREVRVELQTSQCPACGAEATSAAQHAGNLVRLKARKDQYGGLLMGEEILGLRRRYGITQQQASALFGKGKIAFSRYENETSYPDEATTRLLQLAIEKPDVIRWLAEKSGVELPLWNARCEGERRAKLRLLTQVRKVEPGVTSWGKPAVAAWMHPPMADDALRALVRGTGRTLAKDMPANDHEFAMAGGAW